MAAAYRDSRLDGPLLSHCGRDVDKLCMDRAGALHCLRTAIAKVRYTESSSTAIAFWEH
jgi:hypothetical protein